LTAFYPPYQALPAKVNAFTRLIEQVIAPIDPWSAGIDRMTAEETPKDN